MNKNVLFALALLGAAIHCSVQAKTALRLSKKQVIEQQRQQEETEQLYAYKKKIRTRIEEIGNVLRKPAELTHLDLLRMRFEIKNMLNVLNFTIDGVEGIHYGYLNENEEMYSPVKTKCHIL